ncbi:MAG TPA: zinc-ribbon domain-containing protein [Candidatus Nanoarchaeia archaeon]|nr:zinc-ribbon domain-containing protein [Candidatus Nanoarchaeia archaeon]
MPIIFGWGRQTTWKVGPVFRQLCNHCKNDEYWILIRRTTWFTFFFIPIIPYKTQWWLICPICQYGLKLEAEQVKKLQPIAEINQLLAMKKITEQEYQSRIALLEGSSSAPENQNQLIEEKAEIAQEAKTKSVYCDNCGKELTSGGLFCINCGSKINKTTIDT